MLQYFRIPEETRRLIYADTCHIQYLRKYITTLEQAVAADHVDLMRRCPWGCIDLVSAGEMWKCYGFIDAGKDGFGKGVLARSRKDRFRWYKRVIAANRLNLCGLT